MAINSGFTPYGNGYRLDLTTTSASVQVNLQTGQTPQNLRVLNTGAVAVHIVWSYGASAPTAVAPTVGTTQPGVTIGAGVEKVFCVGGSPATGPNLYVAGVTVSGSATIYFQFGDGR